MTTTLRERYERQVADATRLITDALNEGPTTTDEMEALRRSYYLDLRPWKAAVRALKHAGTIDDGHAYFMRIRRKPQAFARGGRAFAPEALRRKRHTVINARYRMGAMALLKSTGCTTLNAAELVDALDATFAILVAKQAGKTTIEELATAAQEATGIERDNLKNVLWQLAKIGVVEGRP